MKTSQAGIDLIKKFEGVRLTAYHLAGEKYNTIGYGHYGADVTDGMKITAAQAEAYLRVDLAKFESYVEKYAKITLTQPMFDALVSYTYNRGPGGMRQLAANCHTPEEYAEGIVTYWGSAIRYKAALLKRRQAEQALFRSGMDDIPATGNPYAVPTKTLKLGSKGNGVRWLQYELNERHYGLIVDGVFGQKTDDAVRFYQKKRGLVIDGIVGAKTRGELLAGK